MPDDNLATDYLTGREAAQAEDNVRFLQGLVGGGGEQAATPQTPEAAAEVAAAPAAAKKVEAEDRTKRGTVVGGLATQAVGGARDAVVQSGRAIEAMTQWLREHTPLGELPEGPKLQVKVPQVRQPEGVAESLTRNVSQFLTGFVPFFKATRAAGLGVGASGAVAGVATDFAAFDPNDPRISNTINELAPALRTPLTEYLAAGPDDSAAEGRFKNAIEGLALGGLAEGVFRAARVLKTAKGISREELKAATVSERGAVRVGAEAAEEMPTVTTFTTAKGSTYTVGEGGITIRNKAARPEHPGDAGIKEASEKTFYADQTAIDALSEFGARGGAKKKLAQTQGGQWGIQYVEGPNAGKFEKRTLVSVSDAPAVGLHPVELFEGGTKVHFGNKITEVKQGAPAPAATPSAKTITLQHGTPLKFERFDPEKASQTGLGERGFFFSEKGQEASAYAETLGNLKGKGPRGAQTITIEVPEDKILDLTNLPPDIKALGSGGNIDRILKEKGYVGFRNAVGEYVIYEPEQFRTRPVAAPTVTPLVQVTRATPEEAKIFLTANPDALNLGDRVLKVGWEQIGDQAGLEEVVNRTTNAFRQQVEVARRGKISDENLRVLARELDMPVEDFLGRRVGAALNAEQSLALVSLLGGSAKRLRGLAGQVAAGNLDARQAMLDQLSLHAAIQEQAFGARAEAGRALRVWGMQADGTIAHSAKLAQAAQEMTGVGGSALDAERMAHMILQLDSPAKIAKMTRDATKPGWADMAGEYWINALLSGPQTHVANFLSNTLTTMWAIPERALAAQLSPRGQGVVSGEATAMLYGFVGGTWDAVRVAGKALRDGVPTREGSKVESYTRKAISGANMGASGDLGRAIDLLGTAVRTPGRFLMASDEFFKTINFRMELNAQAVRQAGHEGLSGKAGAERVAFLLQDADFLKRVKPLADEFADYQTFTKPLGEGGSAIIAWRDSHPAAKLVIPFVRTPVNIFKYVGERTPFLNRLSSEVRADLAAGGARADMARAKTQLGGMVMASTAVLAQSGYVTGRGPRDPKLRREWLETHQPYSVKVGGTWYGLDRLGPVGQMMGMAADFSDIVGDLDEIDASQLAAAMALSVSNNMLSKTYLTGLADTLEAIQSPTEDAAKAFLKLTGTIVPTGVAQVARTMDPTIREVNSIRDAIMARVPGMSSTLPAKMNLWAEPIKLGGGLGPDIVSPIYTKTPELKPVSEEMVKQGVSVGMPGKWIFGTPIPKDPLAEPSVKQGVPLEPHEYEKFVKLAAGHGLGSRMPLLKDALGALIKSDTYQRMSDGPDGVKAQLIRDRIYMYREAARQVLIKDSPELQAQLKRKALQQVDAARPKNSLIPSPGQFRDTSSSVGDMLKDLPGTLNR